MKYDQYEIRDAKSLGSNAQYQSSQKIFIIRILLLCGILSSLLYVAMNIVIASLYEGYDSMSQTVSELSAVDAPTRVLWVQLGFVYTLLVTGFGIGILQSASGNRSLKMVGTALILYGLIGLGWPLAPMHQREVLSAGGGTISDTLHIVFSVVTVLLMFIAMCFAINQFGKIFRLYSIISLLALVGLGIWTGIEGEKLNENIPTPWLGLVERIMIFIFLLWVVIVAFKLLRAVVLNRSS